LRAGDESGESVLGAFRLAHGQRNVNVASGLTLLIANVGRRLVSRRGVILPGSLTVGVDVAGDEGAGDRFGGDREGGERTGRIEVVGEDAGET